MHLEMQRSIVHRWQLRERPWGKGYSSVVRGATREGANFHSNMPEIESTRTGPCQSFAFDCILPLLGRRLRDSRRDKQGRHKTIPRSYHVLQVFAGISGTTWPVGGG